MYENEMKRTPEKWYFNQYQNGRLLLSHGFTTKGLADSFAQNVEKEIARSVAGGCKTVPGIVHKVEEAKGWEVGGRTFDDFNKALRYMWTEYPGRVCINGVF